MTKTFISTVSKQGKNGLFIRIPSKDVKDFEDLIGSHVKVVVEPVT